MNGPLNEFFLAQFWFERLGQWPFGERPHGQVGIAEAYADALDIPHDEMILIDHLKLLTKDWPKGHWLCPCGSGELLRHCHRDEMMALHQKVPPGMAIRMLRRLRSYDR